MHNTRSSHSPPLIGGVPAPQHTALSSQLDDPVDKLVEVLLPFADDLRERRNPASELAPERLVGRHLSVGEPLLGSRHSLLKATGDVGGVEDEVVYGGPSSLVLRREGEWGEH